LIKIIEEMKFVSSERMKVVRPVYSVMGNHKVSQGHNASERQDSGRCEERNKPSKIENEFGKIRNSCLKDEPGYSVAARIVGKKWTIEILQKLATVGDEGLRFNELRNSLEPISSKVLTDKLRDLEENNLIIRQKNQFTIPSCLCYILSKPGRDLLPIIKALDRWERKYKRDQVNELVKDEETRGTSTIDPMDEPIVRSSSLIKWFEEITR
jgi:DNA-binding HxlR family transcriptional regulator